MEKIVVIGLVAASVYWIIRMFIKQTDGKGGCSCDKSCNSCEQIGNENHG